MTPAGIYILYSNRCFHFIREQGSPWKSSMAASNFTVFCWLMLCTARSVSGICLSSASTKPEQHKFTLKIDQCQWLCVALCGFLSSVGFQLYLRQPDSLNMCPVDQIVWISYVFVKIVDSPWEWMRMSQQSSLLWRQSVLYYVNCA